MGGTFPPNDNNTKDNSNRWLVHPYHFKDLVRFRSRVGRTEYSKGKRFSYLICLDDPVRIHKKKGLDEMSIISIKHGIERDFGLGRRVLNLNSLSFIQPSFPSLTLVLNKSLSFRNDIWLNMVRPDTFTKTQDYVYNYFTTKLRIRQ